MASYTVVGASASPLYTERPNLIRSAILRAKINDWPTTETILDAVINGFNINYRRAYEFGVNDYYRGTWLASSEDDLIDWDSIKNWLSNKLGVPASSINFTYKDYSRYLDAPYEFALSVNSVKGNLDYSTGYITDYPPFDLPEGYVAYVTQYLFEREETDDDRIEGETYVKVIYSIFDPDNKESTLQENLEYSFNSVLNDQLSVRPTYLKMDFTINGGETLYFCYDPEDNFYPDLSQLLLSQIQSRYFPLAELISGGSISRDGNFIGEDPRLSEEDNKKEKDQTIQLLEYYNVDFEEIIKSLKTNPDINDIDRAYIAPALIISDLIEIDSYLAAYLFKFIDYIITTYKPKTKEEYEEYGDRYIGDTSYLRVYEGIASSYKNTLRWAYMDIISIPFEQGKSGYYFGKNINYNQPYGESDTTGVEGELSYIYVDFFDPKSNTAKRARIGGLTNILISNYLNPDQTPYYSLREAFPLTTEDTLSGIVLPINIDVLNSMGRLSATSVMVSSLTLVTQAFEQIKLKWYEREDFWDAIKIIIFVVSVVYMSPQISAAANQGISELVTYILESIIIGQLVSEAVGFVLSILADAIGGEAAVIVAAIAAAAAAIYGGTQSFNLNLPFADEVLKLSNVIMTQTQALQQKRVKQFQEDVAEFKEDYNALLNEIEEAADLLPDLLMNPYWLLDNSVSILNESSNDFIARNTNLNPNELCFSAITNFTDNALRLPTLADVNNNF